MTKQDFRRALSVAAFINSHEGCDAVLTGTLELRVTSEACDMKRAFDPDCFPVERVTETIPGTITAALNWLGY